MGKIISFKEWNLLETLKYHFSFNNKRYTIHQAETNSSKFGIKDKKGNWEVYVRDDIFDPKRFDMEDDEFLTWRQKRVKHFNMLGKVARTEVANSDWKKLFRYELKHDEPLNKRLVIFKLQAGRRNAKWNIENRTKKED